MDSTLSVVEVPQSTLMLFVQKNESAYKKDVITF